MVDLKIKLPEDFLNEEERSGFTITSEMKEVWAVELDLLAQVQQICEKYGIRYFASGGTLLGTIRHDGFIPWDDDIDITMLREDYEKFCSHADEFLKPYELQFFGKTRGYLTGHAQLRNVNTTAVRKTSLKDNYKTIYNQGIFIDIFPLDAVPDDPETRRKFCKKLRAYKKFGNTVYRATEGYYPERADFKRKLVHNLWKLVPKKFSYRFFHGKFLKMCQKYNNTDTEFVSMLSFIPKNEKLWIKRENLSSPVSHKFEFMEMVIEENFDGVLKVQYGDYMTPVQGGCYHGEILFNTSVAYKDWLRDHNKK